MSDTEPHDALTDTHAPLPPAPPDEWRQCAVETLDEATDVLDQLENHHVREFTLEPRSDREFVIRWRS
jgi:hypothetical protein